MNQRYIINEDLFMVLFTPKKITHDKLVYIGFVELVLPKS